VVERRSLTTICMKMKSVTNVRVKPAPGLDSLLPLDPSTGTLQWELVQEILVILLEGQKVRLKSIAQFS
jgi:hypothetical protein